MHDWDAIQRQYGELTYATAYRILRKYDLAVDCMQDVFVELYQNFKNTPVANWPALLRWLAVRRALDSLRVQRRAEACSESLSHEIEQNSRAPLHHNMLNSKSYLSECESKLPNFLQNKEKHSGCAVSNRPASKK